MHDLLDSAEFSNRTPKTPMDQRRQLALKMIGEKLAETPDVMLQQLCEAAVQYCGADSAGVSLEEPDAKGGPQFRWVAVAGSFERYWNGTTPRNASPCGVCVDQWRPQHYSVSQPFYDSLGVTAAPILDGMLIPWASDSARGTLWAVSHQSKTAFDMGDYSMLSALADLVSLAVRHQRK